MFLNVDHTYDIVIAQYSCDVTALTYDFIGLFFACTHPKVGFSETQCGFTYSPEKCGAVRSYYPVAAAMGKLFAVWLSAVWEKC